ncbi:prolipoprotein diacylglyceryl transferase [Candidatus Uhrbacteria bacterium]|nr:prolipoprotein diacylglyceryl transferase [Candidatus Uhrbacteria bacterium]
MEGVRIVGISGYGLLISLGFLVAYCAALFFARRSATIRTDHIDSVLLWALIPAVIGARVLFVVYHLDYFGTHPQENIAVWNGGWVWHGGLLGGILGVYGYCRKTHISFLSLLDVLAPGVALGQAIGRWGNYVNQEAYGLPTDVPWGITIDTEKRLPGYESFATFHPTFLYESIFDVLLFLFLGWLVWRRGGGWIPASAGMTNGTVFFLYLILYSLGRFGIEFLRIDIVPLAFGLRAPQWISLGFMIVGTLGLVWVLRKEKKVV